MKLPAGAVIAEDKLTHYLLVRHAHGDKSAFLAQAGYALENAGQLPRDLRSQILPLDAQRLESNEFGQYYPNTRDTRRPKRRGPARSHHLDHRTLVGRHEVRYTDPGHTENIPMKFELYTDVALTRDLPEHRLRRGDIVKLVDHHMAPDGTEGYSIEVFNALGETIAVTAVPASALEALRGDEVLCARPL
ncbi:MAG: DUF4926 domain-containing protein [Nitrospira sp.]|nr:DUF4926 domain-containing protein [Nitrospira sp.]